MSNHKKWKINIRCGGSTLEVPFSKHKTLRKFVFILWVIETRTPLIKQQGVNQLLDE
jgi:hypothetical protein